jgi:predicted CopG family antitoxin
MTVRTITVTEEAYRRLRAHRGASGSFSELVIRLTRRRPLSDFAGVLGHRNAEALRAAIEEDRARRRRSDQ